jgi:hypothetical protein
MDTRGRDGERGRGEGREWGIRKAALCCFGEPVADGFDEAGVFVGRLRA